jgi:hypothetical protein
LKTEITYDGIKYTLSNEDLKVGDEVYPISRGRVIEDLYYHEKFDYRDFMSGFPEEPHILLDLHHSDSKPYESRTDHGYSPIESYYKIINKQPVANSTGI